MPTENENQSAQVSGVPPPTACSAKEMDNLLLQECTVCDVPRGISFYQGGEIVMRLDESEERFLLEWLCIKHGINMQNPSCLGTGHLVAGTQHNVVGLSEVQKKKG